MYPVIFQFGSFVIYTYGLSLALASFIATFLIWRRARKLGFNEEHIIDMVLFALFMALVFSRAVYVASHWSQFSSELLKILLITKFPGLDGIAAFFGGCLGFLVFLLSKRWNLQQIFDCVVVGLSLAIFIVMVGAFFAGNYSGVTTTSSFGVYLPGVIEARQPYPLYYGLVSVVLYVVLVLLDKKRAHDGLLYSFFFVVFGLAIVVVDIFNAARIMLGPLSIAQLGGLVLFTFGVLQLYILYGVRHRKSI